jgi:hypothetical protein
MGEMAPPSTWYRPLNSWVRSTTTMSWARSTTQTRWCRDASRQIVHSSTSVTLKHREHGRTVERIVVMACGQTTCVSLLRVEEMKGEPLRRPLTDPGEPRQFVDEALNGCFEHTHEGTSGRESRLVARDTSIWYLEFGIACKGACWRQPPRNRLLRRQKGPPPTAHCTSVGYQIPNTKYGAEAPYCSTTSPPRRSTTSAVGSIAPSSDSSRSFLSGAPSSTVGTTGAGAAGALPSAS